MSEDGALKAFAGRLCDAMRRKGLISGRNRSGVDVAVLATECGLSYEMARRYVEGRAMPRTEVLDGIAGFLGVSAYSPPLSSALPSVLRSKNSSCKSSDL